MPENDIAGSWFGFLTVHSRVTRKLDTSLSASHGMPITEFEVLLKLTQHGRPMRMSDLADACLLSRSGLTRIVDELEAQDLVRRESDLEDGRVLRATLTRPGVARFRAARRAHLANVRRLFLDPLTIAQREVLAASWQAILANMDQQSPPGARPRRRAGQRTS